MAKHNNDNNNKLIKGYGDLEYCNTSAIVLYSTCDLNIYLNFLGTTGANRQNRFTDMHSFII